MAERTRLRVKSRESLEAIRGYMEHFSCGAIRYHEASDGFVIVFEDEADLKIARQAFGE